MRWCSLRPASHAPLRTRCPCVHGSAVNVAARMESTSQPMRIQVGSTTARLLASAPECASEFVLERRGLTEIKGKG